MENYQLDLGLFRTNVIKADSAKKYPEILETQGERYIFENIVQKCIAGQEVCVCDIDFNAFEEDDIVELIDEKSRQLDNVFSLADRIVTAFDEGKPINSIKKKFF